MENVHNVNDALKPLFDAHLIFTIGDTPATYFGACARHAEQLLTAKLMINSYYSVTIDGQA